MASYGSGPRIRAIDLSSRWGLLKRLPEDYVGERHVVVVEREPPSSSNTGQCEFEERPGPAPLDLENQACVVYLTPDEMKF